MKLKVPDTCKECPSYRKLHDDFYFCNMECLFDKHPEQDMTSIKVEPDTRPDWCQVNKLSETISNLGYKEQIAVKAMATLFGAGDILEDDIGEITEIVRCKDCKFSDRWDRGYFCMKEIGIPNDPIHNGDWFCADGERELDDG